MRNNDDFRVSDLVFVQYRKKLQRNWSRRTEQDLYRIERVLTSYGRPYRYQLRDVMSNEIVDGYFGGEVGTRNLEKLTILLEKEFNISRSSAWLIWKTTRLVRF